MKKTLTHAQIIKGRRYKVIATPKHLLNLGLEKYPWFNMIGEAIWIDAIHDMIGMQFGGCKLRGIPSDCLEETDEPITDNDSKNDPQEKLRLWFKDLAEQKAAEDAKKQGMITKHTARLGQLYRIVKVPEYWKRISGKRQYPSLGCIGRLMNIRDNYGTLMLSDKVQRFVPFDCMEIVTIRIPPIKEIEISINDRELIAKIVAKPRGTLKIIRGLAHMNKDYRLCQFLDRGVIF